MAIDRQVEQFLEQGYVPVPRFLDDDLLARVRTHSAHELARLQANPVDDPLVVSAANRTDQQRRSLIFAYITPAARAADTGARPIESIRLS